MYFSIQKVWQRQPPLKHLVASYLGFNAEENERQANGAPSDSDGPRMVKNPTISDLKSFLGQI